MHPIHNARIRLSQGQIFWREVGQGIPVLFLHGSWTTGEDWLPVVQQLSSKHHCILPDMLGFGESDRPKASYSIELEVECLTELVEVLRLRQFYLVGHEVGGWIAVSYALRYPDLVKGVVLLSPEGVKTPGSGKRWGWSRWLMMKPPVMLWILKAIAPLAKLMGQDLTPLFQLRKKLRRSPVACRLLFRRRAAEIQAELLNDRLGWLKLPILLINGDQAEGITRELVQTYAQAPHSRVELLPGANLISEESEAVAEAIRVFTKSLQ